MQEATFSVQVKLELARLRPKLINTRQAVIAGLFCSFAAVDCDAPANEIKVIPEIKEQVCELLRNEEISYRADGGRIAVAGETRDFFAQLFGQCFKPEGMEMLPADEDFVTGFMRGAFLASGYCSDPKKSYRIEFHIPNECVTELICRMLARWDIKPIVKRREQFNAIYFKVGDRVSDFIGYVGAAHARLEFESTRISKSVQSVVTRAVNCDEGNTRRLAEAAANRNELIKRLMESSKAVRLTPELVSAAKANLENPGASIAELGAMMNPPIGKSGMNHRLRKLIEIAEAID